MLKSIKSAACIWILLFCVSAMAQQPFVYDNNKTESQYIGKSFSILVDTTCDLNVLEVKDSPAFVQSRDEIPNLGYTSASVWVKFTIQNNTPENKILLELHSPLTDRVELFTPNNDGSMSSQCVAQDRKFSDRRYKHTSYLFDLDIVPGDSKTYFMKINSCEKVELPVTVTTPLLGFSSATTHHFVFGIYAGIMLIMIFYNLFIYFSIRDKSYLYYVLYILAVMLTQLTFQGYTFRYVWPASPSFEIMSIQLMSILVGVASVKFLQVFLLTSHHLPKIDKVFSVAYILYGIVTVLVLLGFYHLTWILILCIVSPLSLLMLYAGYNIASKGYRPAKYFSIAWSIFLAGVFIYSMKDFEILPHNAFTIYTMPVGSAIETVLLSFALGDKINALTIEKERSQNQALHALQENERMIKQQNTILETKVNERTIELQSSNSNLKETQSQLVNSEKMASLGQLTAGIAHEINNPINSVYGNVKPLKRDLAYLLSVLEKYEAIKTEKDLAEMLPEIENYKKKNDMAYVLREMNTLIKGIDEGSARTIEIVKSLKNFARMDEPGVKRTNIISGLDSTLLLLNSIIKRADIKVTSSHEDPALEIDCFGGQINQVFMNILTNAIQAMESAGDKIQEKQLFVHTRVRGDMVVISIKDTGPGIPEKIKGKIFEPFFTTKSVGEGTGLGLSISFNIVKSHKGEINVISAEGKGTEFIITLPLHQQI